MEDAVKIDRGMMRRWMGKIGQLFIGCLGLWLTLGDLAPVGAEVALVAYDYPPYYSARPMEGKGLNNKGHGFVVDIVRAAYGAVGKGVRVAYQPMARSVLSLKSGAYVGHIGSRQVLGLSIEPEDLDSVKLSHYYVFFHYFKSRFKGGLPSHDQLSDLRGYTVASIIGSPAGERLRKEGFRVDFGPELENGMWKLATGRVDFWSAVGLTAQTLVARHLPDRVDGFFAVEGPIFGGSVDLNFNIRHRAYTVRKLAFIEGMERIRKSGTYHRILASYFKGQAIPDYVTPAFPAPGGGIHMHRGGLPYP